jgi:hypothetical protein
LKYINKTNTNFKTQLKIRWWCNPFALANTLSPFGMNHQKRRLCEPFLNFLPFGKQYMSERLYQCGEMAEYRQRVDNMMELSGSVIFAEYSISLSIL